MVGLFDSSLMLTVAVHSICPVSVFVWQGSAIIYCRDNNYCLQNIFNLTVETVIFQELDIAILVEQDDMTKNIYPNIHLKI